MRLRRSKFTDGADFRTRSGALRITSAFPGHRLPNGRVSQAFAVCLLVGVAGVPQAFGQEPVIQFFRPDQKTIQVRDPAALPKAPLPNVPPPVTVANPQWDSTTQTMGLDEAIRIALANTNVVRVLTGVTASSSGETIYDPAITNVTIDEAKARFDPTVNANNTFSRRNPPLGVLDPLDPSQALIVGTPTQSYDLDLNVSKVNSLGGTAGFGVNVNPSRTRTDLLPLNPQTRTSLDVNYTQPLLQGAGLAANLAPILISRLETERSFFQFKATVQQMVQGVIQAYWSVVFARTEVWARRRQVEQGTESLDRAESRLAVGRADIAEVSQARSALANFKATLLGSEANLLNQEAALANIMGLLASARFLPISPPGTAAMEINWEEVVKLAGEYRPDLIELKLILEAGQQRLVQARNQAQPKLDAVMLYRWNGLEGTMPNRAHNAAFGGTFSDWDLGINFSVPLGLRQTRAALRRQELILARDRANLDQGLHATTHLLALRVRNLSQYYTQYRAYYGARVAARINLEFQMENYRRGRSIYLNVLQAITDWGNNVTAESQSLTLYNTELANLELETGTILESHGIRFSEERYGSLGPLGRLGKVKPYPKALPPGPNAPQYPQGKEPAESTFELDDPRKAKSAPPMELPKPRELREKSNSN